RSGLSITASERFFMLSIVDPPLNIGKLNRAKTLQRSESCCGMSRAAGSGFLGSAGFAAFFRPAFFYRLVGAAQSQRIGRNILRDALAGGDIGAGANADWSHQRSVAAGECAVLDDRRLRAYAI